MRQGKRPAYGTRRGNAYAAAQFAARLRDNRNPACPTPDKRAFNTAEAAEANNPLGLRVYSDCPCGAHHHATPTGWTPPPGFRTSNPEGIRAS